MSNQEIPPFILRAINKDEALNPEELNSKAQKILDTYGGPYVSPDYKNRNVPGILGARTMPLPVVSEKDKLEGTVFLAQQYPTMGKLLIFENQFAERGIIHSFDPQFFSVNYRVNAHLGLEGNLSVQRPALATKLLEYMANLYSRT